MGRRGGQFGVDYGAILALATGMFVLYGLLSLPQGWLAARFGRPRLMAVFFLGTGLAMVATGFAGTPGMLAGGLAPTGPVPSTYHPPRPPPPRRPAPHKPGRPIG